MKVYINGSGHVTKMATMAINSKNLKNAELRRSISRRYYMRKMGNMVLPRAISPASGEQIVMSPSLKGNNCPVAISITWKLVPHEILLWFPVHLAMLVQKLYDATLASLSVLKKSRWRPRWSP